MILQLRNGNWINARRDGKRFRADAHRAGENIREVFGPLEYIGGVTRQYTTEADAEAGGPCVCCPLERMTKARLARAAEYDAMLYPTE